MKLELNHPYSTAELCRAMEISSSTFRAKKNEFLSCLGAAYEYQVKEQGRKIVYTFFKEIGDYCPPLKKADKARITQVVQTFINESIEKDPVNTAANINRLAWRDSKTNPTPVALLGLKESTTGVYIRINLAEMYGNRKNPVGTIGHIVDRVWVYLDASRDVYIKMPDEQIAAYRAVVKNFLSQKADTDSESVEELYDDYLNGLVSKEEWEAKAANAYEKTFKGARQYFKDTYGYWPIKAPVYALNAWEEDPSSSTL